MDATEKISRGRTFLILFILCFTVYNNALYNGFIYDDKDVIEGNESIRSIRYIPKIFSTDVWGSSSEHDRTNYYRPVIIVLFMAIYHIFGLQPWAFHLVNIFFHSGVCYLVFLLGLKILGNKPDSNAGPYLSAPFIAAVLFAVHPVHTEAVTWADALSELSVALFALLSLLCFIRATETAAGHRGYYFLSVFVFFIGTLCKEIALLLPVFFFIYDRQYNNSSVRSSLMKCAPYIPVAAFYLILRFHAIGFTSSRSYDLSPYQQIINIFPIFSGYLQKLLLPVNLHFWYTFHPLISLISLRAMISCGIALAFAAAAYLAFKRNRAIFFSLLLILIPLLPAFFISLIPGKPFAERYLYLPSVGFVFLSAIVISGASERMLTRAAAMAFLLVLVGVYSAETISRNPVWKDEYSFWSDTAMKAPDSDLSRYNLGLALLEKGMADRAIGEFQSALSLNPKEDRAYHNLGLAYLALNLPDLAIGNFRAAMKFRPNRAETRFGLGLAYMRKHMTDEALEEFRNGLKLKPNDVRARWYTGRALLDKGMAIEAVEEYKSALKIEPENADIRNDLGKAYKKAGLPDKAIEEFKDAIKLNPDYAEAHYNLSLSYKEKGAIDKTIYHLEIAAKLKPDNSEYRSDLASAYSQQKNIRR